MRGFATIKVEDTVLNLHFGMNALAIFCERTGTNLTNYSEGLSRADSLRELIYSGVTAYAFEHEQPEPYTIYQIGNFIDELTPEVLTDVIAAMTDGWMRWGLVQDDGKKKAKPKK